MPGKKGRETTVFLVGESALQCMGVRGLLEPEPDIDVIGDGGNRKESIGEIKTLMPDVVVIVVVGVKRDIEITKRVRAEAPQIPVIVLAHPGEPLIKDLLEVGVGGLVLNDSAPADLAQAVRAATRGDVFLGSSLVRAFISDQQTVAVGLSETTPPASLLQTKLRHPASPVDLVARPRLYERLAHGRLRPLTLVSAPVGYGKSVLIGSWLEQCDWPSAWLSLDESDSELRQFLTYFLAAVQGAFPDACQNTLQLVNSAQVQSVATLALSLSNELGAIDEPFFLVLDDYHHIRDESTVNELLARLLVHPPLPLHLVLVSRRDPPIPLVALRAEGQVTELRVQDLMLQASETEALLRKIVAVDLSEEILGLVQRKMEGWAVGVRLVALALREGRDADAFLNELPGGSPHVHEYLAQEVIADQSPEMREWLLRSAILGRFCPALCDAVCATDDALSPELDGQRFVDALQQSNLFIIPLDPHSGWFRYHQLFRDLLCEQLQHRAAQEQVATLHTRASEWFETQGLVEEAIVHALSAGNELRAAEIVERHQRAELDRDRWGVVQQWLGMLPAELREQRPRLLLAEAWTAFFEDTIGWTDGLRGQPLSARVNLRQRILTNVEAVESLLPEDDTLETEWISDLTFFRGLRDYTQGDSESGRRYFAEAQARYLEKSGALYGFVGLYLGLAHQMSGEKEIAIQTLDRLISTGSPGGVGRVLIELLCGELAEARIQEERLLALPRERRIGNSTAWSAYLLALTHLHANELDEALSHFTIAARQRHVLNLKTAMDTLAGLALTQQLLQQGNAAQTSGELLEFAQETLDASCLSVAHSCRARLCVLRGDLDAALQWARPICETPVSNQLFIRVEVPVITRARVLIAGASDEDLAQATELLRATRQQSMSLRHTCQTIEVAVLQSLVLDKQGNTADATDMLAEALALAKPGGWIRPFVELGRPMADLLQRQDLHSHADFAAQILSSPRDQPAETLCQPGPVPVEKLTNRELDILELVAQRMQNKEIAARLDVAPETVKTHLKHLYEKLHVHSRREAVAKGAQILAVNAAQIRRVNGASERQGHQQEDTHLAHA